MSSKAEEAGMEMQEAKEEEAVKSESERPEIKSERSPSPVQQCVSLICKYWKTMIVTAVVIAVIMVVIAVIMAFTTLLIIQNQKISALEERQHQLTNDHTQTREELNTTREIVHNARASITVLEDGLKDTKQRTSVMEGELANTKMEVSSLNKTKASKVSVDKLTERVEELEKGKVDRTEFEDLSDEFKSLRETSEFYLTVDGIHNTTVAIQTDIAQLTQNLTSLAHNTNVALSTKADQHDVDTLSEQLTSLSEETVRNTTFRSAIDSLSTSKANQSDLDSLEGRMDHLEDTTAKKNKLSSLEHEVTNHISDSQSTHNQLSSRIGSNDADIESNTQRIDQLEADVADSSPGLKQFWIMAIVPAVIMAMIG